MHIRNQYVGMIISYGFREIMESIESLIWYNEAEFHAMLAMPLSTIILLLCTNNLLQVTGIVGRADVLACIFFLASLLTYHG